MTKKYSFLKNPNAPDVDIRFLGRILTEEAISGNAEEVGGVLLSLSYFLKSTKRKKAILSLM